MANTQLTKSVQKNAGNDAITKMTYSVWIKRSALGEADIFAAHQLSSYYTDFYFDSNDRLNLYSYINSSEAAWVQTNRRFKDTNAWYHLVFAVDTTQGTAANRVKFYVNGTQETSMNSTVYPSQNSAFGQFSDTGATLYIGNNPNRTAFSGSMSHIHYTPYTTYDASPFGSTDATTGEWKINTAPSVTYSTAGFFILKNDNSVTDQSPNTNNFTVGAGTLTKTEDCPSNVFATLNPLSTFPVTGTSGYFSNGNTVYDAPSGSPYDISCGSTLGVKGGKWYWEVKWNIDGGGSQALGLGIYEADQPINLFGNMRGASGYKNVIWDTRHDLYVNGSDTGTNYTASSGDILGFALDLDAGTLKIHQNGTYYNSGNAVTSAIDVSKTYLILASPNGGSSHSTASFNFGNGYFGTTAVSSAGTNASGIGIFEYDVPTGFTALSTKGLNL